MKGTPFLQRFPSSWQQMANFYVWLLSSCFLLSLFLLLILLRNLSPRWLRTEAAEEPRLPNLENIVLGIGFLLLPAYGIVIAKIAHAIFLSLFFVRSFWCLHSSRTCLWDKGCVQADSVGDLSGGRRQHRR
jgi:uncharacterized membrane protein (DUF485 family)